MADLGMPDTSMYGHIQPVQIPNLLGMAQSFANTQGAMQENEMRRRTIAARQAFGQIMQQNVRPDGSVDYENAAVMMSANPATAWAAPEFIKDMAVNKGLSIDNTMKKLELAFRQQDAIAQTLAPLTQYGSNITHDQVQAAATQLYNSGMLGTGEDAQRMLLSVLQDMPQDGPGLFQKLMDYTQRSKQTAETLHRTAGDVMSFANGPQQQFVTVSPFTGVKQLGNAPLGLTPSESSSLVPTKAGPGARDANGNPIPAGTPIAVNRANLQGAPPVVAGMPGAVATTGGLRGGAPAQGQAPSAMSAPPVGGPPPTGAALPQAPNAAGGSSGMTENPALTPGSAAQLSQAPGGIAGSQPTGAVVGPSDQVNELRNAYVAEKTALQTSISASLPQLLQMKEALGAMGPGGANTGGMAGWRAKAANIMYGLGFDKDFVNAVGNGNLPLSQVIEKISATNSFQTLHQLLGGQNRATNLFVSMLHDNLPNIETHPAAAKEIYALFARMYSLQAKELKGMAQWEQSGHPPEDFLPQGWIPWVNSPKGQAYLNHLMTTTPEILQPEASRVVGTP